MSAPQIETALEALYAKSVATGAVDLEQHENLVRYAERRLKRAEYRAVAAKNEQEAALMALDIARANRAEFIANMTDPQRVMF